MSKIKTLFPLLFIGSLLVTGCGGKSNEKSEISSNSSDISASSNSSEPEKTNFDKALLAVSNFDIEQTNGYDYSLKQYLGKDVINSDDISLRVDFSNEIKAQKTETTKRLNTYGGEQFTTTEVITYFSNNMICEYKNNQWKWSNYKKSAFFSNAVSELKFGANYLTSIKENLGDEYVLSADVPNEKIKDFLKTTDTSFSDLSLKLTVSSDFKNFKSLELSYFQTYTRSEMKFETYRGAVSIVLPD